jgi:hypothetical protein
MTTYTSVFGTETVPPSDNAYSAYVLTTDVTFFWPEAASGTYLVADVMDFSCASPFAITLPDASLVSNGRAIVLLNSGAVTFTYKDFGGNTLGTLDAGISKCIFVTSNTTQNGVWNEFAFGAVASSINPAALDGYGLLVTGSELSVEATTRAVAASDSIVASDRAGCVLFEATGAITCSLLQAATATNGFFTLISNQGTGNLIIDPTSSETIDGETTKTLAPGESTFIVSTGAKWVSVGYGRSTKFQFTKLIFDVSAGTPFTLTSSQAENKLIQFIGVLTAPAVVIVPSVVAVYYIDCAYTGAYTVTVQTATGTSIELSALDRAIAYCDGVNVVLAQTSTVPATDIAGGVAGVVVYQDAINSTAFTAVGTTGHILVSGGAGAPQFGGAAIAPAGLTVTGLVTFN